MDKETIENADTERIESASPPSHGDGLRGWKGIKEEARNATEQEHQMGFVEAVNAYPQACFWSIVVSLVVIMNGYDTALIGSLFGFPAFQQRFGVADPAKPGAFQVTAKWQDALGLASPLGNIVGIFINANLTELFGHKKTLLGFMVFLTGCIFIAFFAVNVQMLFVGELLSGLAWGCFTTLAPAYASEVAPTVLRGYLETYVVLCWGIGQLLSYAVLDSLDGNATQWAWRIPFAVQWIWPVIIIPLVAFAPESPWWYVRKGRLEDAERSVKRLSAKSQHHAAHQAVALMVETTKLEQAMTEGARYVDCFKGSNLWRTEIGCIAWSCQVFVGFAITSYAAYFFEQAGLPSTDAYKLTVGQGGLHFLCTLLSCFITARTGRRKMFMCGAIWMTLMWLIVGCLGTAPQGTGIGYASATVYLLWYIGYELTIGPVAFIIVGETSSTRLRSKSIALGRNAYNVFDIISFTVAPYLLNPLEGNLKGKSAFVAMALCVVTIVWAYFRLPECKGRTYEELDILFSKNLKAWQFRTYQIDRATEIEEKAAVAELDFH